MKIDSVKGITWFKDNAVSLIILAVVVNLAVKVALTKEKALTQLKAQKETELKKNQKLEEIVALEKKMDSLRTVVNAKSVESQQIFGKLDKFAKEAQVKIVMKPPEETSMKGYRKYRFPVSLSAANYHQLARFIDLVEHAPEIFFIDELTVSGPRSQKQDEGIAASMVISTVFIDSGKS